MRDSLSDKAAAYLRKLCVEIDNRRVGSAGNRAATDFFAETVAAFGWVVETSEFECVDWTQDGADLTASGASFTIFPSPYALGCDVRVPLVVVSTVDELEAADLRGKVVLLRGDIAREQIMPKNFPFYNPDEHKRIVALLEAKQPLAIAAATSRDVQMVGSMYPFPMFEDGDFDIPSVYMTDEEGRRLAEHAGEVASLCSRALRIPSTGCNVVARRGDPARRIVVFAHIDARIGTPGAGDNASGTIALLLLAELLRNYDGALDIELVAMNGEDYFSNPGEQQWLALNEGGLGNILLGINVDDVGYRKGRVAYSLYDCPPDIAAAIRETLAAHAGLMEGEPWYQGDHGLFLLNGVPALALTSELVAELMAEITHTPKDTPDTVDPAKLAEVAVALRDVVVRLAGREGAGTKGEPHLPTSEQMDELLRFLALLEQPGRAFIESWAGGETTGDGAITMPYPIYADDVLEFFWLAGQPWWSDYDYEPRQAWTMLQDDDFISGAGLDEIRTMLTYCVRGERFSDGHWAAMLEAGRVQAILRRLQVLRQ